MKCPRTIWYVSSEIPTFGDSVCLRYDGPMGRATQCGRYSLHLLIEWFSVLTGPELKNGGHGRSQSVTYPTTVPGEFCLACNGWLLHSRQIWSHSKIRIKLNVFKHRKLKAKFGHPILMEVRSIPQGNSRLIQLNRTLGEHKDRLDARTNRILYAVPDI
jgi:hypothetical protein